MEAEAVFLALGFVSPQSQPHWRGCSFGKASPKAKNPRSALATVFLYPLQASRDNNLSNFFPMPWRESPSEKSNRPKAGGIDLCETVSAMKTKSLFERGFTLIE